jgi:4-amino-4-deoxy-L-arabinose transferase-like glycosyltransferase
VISEADGSLRSPLYQRGWFVVAIAVSVAVLMRMPGLDVAVWNVDEAYLAGIAAVSLDGGTPYQDWVDHRAPLTNVVYLIVFLVFGRYNMVAIHLVLLALVVLLIVMTYHLGRRLVGRPGAGVAALLFAVVSSAGYPASDLFAFNAEWGLALSAAVGMLLLVRGLTARAGIGMAVASGAALAIAIGFKQPALFELLAAVVFVLLIVWRPDRDLEMTSAGEALRWLIAMACGALAVVALLAAVVLGYGVWQEFVFYSVTYNTEYYAAPFSLPAYLANAKRAWLEAARPVGIGWLAGAGAMMIVVGLVRRSRSESSEIRSLQMLLPLWACGSFLGVTASGRVFPHYFIQLLIPWCLLAGFAVQELVKFSGGWARSRLRPGVHRAIALVAVLAAAVWFVVLPWRDVTPARIELQSRWVTDQATERVAEYVQWVTGPQDKIFVWGFYPIPYALSKRLPAARFLYCTFVTGANVGGGAAAEDRPIPGAMGELLDDLQRNRPAYIIDTSPGGYFHWGRYPPERYPRLNAFIETHYLLDQRYLATHGGDRFRLFVRRSG